MPTQVIGRGRTAILAVTILGLVFAGLPATVLAVAPSPPATPDLAAASDSGISNSDNITNISTGLVFNGAAGSAVAGATVEVLVDGAQTGSDATAAGDGSYTVTSGAIAPGTHSVTATQTVSAETSLPSAPLTIVIDTTPPTVSPPTLGSTSPTNAASVAFTVTFSEPVVGVSTTPPGNFSLSTTGFTTAPSISGISSDTASATRTVTVVTGTGDGTIKLNVASTTGITDIAGNGLAGTVVGTAAFVIDKTAPTTVVTFPTNGTTYVLGGAWSNASFITGTAADTGGAIVASVSYSLQRAATGLWWNGTGFASGTEVRNLASGTTSWSAAFPFSNFPSDGTYTLRAYATDTAGNVTTSPTAISFVIDTKPTVTLTSTPVGGSTTSGTIHVVVTFSESVSGFTSSGPFVTNASLVNFSGSGASYSFDLLPISAGTVSVVIPAGVATGASGTNQVSNTLSWTFDASGPSVTVNQASTQADPTGASPINFTVTFSVPVTGFDSSSDVTVSGTATGTKTISITALSSQVYTVGVSGMTSSGTVILSVPADKALSITGSHPNKASTSTDNTVTYILPAKWIVTPANLHPVPGATIAVTAQLADVNGNAAPASGVVVTWSSTNGGAFSSSTSTTNASGLATVNFTVSTTIGTIHTVTATGSSVTGTSAIITVTANPAVINLTSSLLATTYRQSVTLTAQFASNGANRTIQFQRLSPVDANWVTIATITTNTFGMASTTYAPPYNTQFRVSFAGANDLSAGTSNVITVLVRHKLTFAAGGTSKFYSNGTRVSYSATVRPIAPSGLQRVTFLIYKRVNGHWTFRTSATIQVNSMGQATFSWRWTHGQWYIRARGNATRYNAATLSPIAKVTVP